MSYTEADGERLSLEFSSMVLDAVVAAPYVLGSEDFLESYHQVLPLYVASGTPEAELQHIVYRRNMSRYFKGVRGVPARKEQILTGLILQGGFSPGRVLMVGEALADWEGAKEAGTAFIGRVEHVDVSIFQDVRI